MEAISGVVPVRRYEQITPTSRPPETTPDAREIARQENDALRTAEAVRSASPAHLSGQSGPVPSSGVGTRLNVVPVSGDVEGSLQTAGVQIARAYARGEPTPEEMRAGSDAYRAEAAARDELARQRQGEGARTLDVLA
jgi:hypothetical protein